MDQNSGLISAVKGWLDLDDEIKTLQQKMKVLRQQKKVATEALTEAMQEKDIGVVNLGDGKGRLTRKERIKKGGITKKYLDTCLQQLFHEDAAQQERIRNHIMDNRPLTVKDEVHRKKSNK